MPGTILGAGDTVGNKTKNWICAVLILMGKERQKMTTKQQIMSGSGNMSKPI